MISRLHFVNDDKTMKNTAALVATCKERITFPVEIDSPRHSIQIALTPGAAAALLRLLHRHPGDLCGDLRQLNEGLTSAATNALMHS